MRVVLLFSALAFSVAALPSPPSWAYRDYFTPEQKALLDKIQTLRIEAIALTDKGAVMLRRLPSLSPAGWANWDTRLW